MDKWSLIDVAVPNDEIRHRATFAVKTNPYYRRKI